MKKYGMKINKGLTKVMRINDREITKMETKEEKIDQADKYR